MNVILDYQRICEQAARKAGAILVELLGRAKVREKAPTDFVTEADLASQESVRQTILTAFPDHVVLGEEDQVHDARPASGYRWIVDPLDGTTNYVHQYPFFAVSLALEHHGELQVGVIFDPLRNECFSAVKGQGAFLNGERLQVSRATELSRAMLSVGLPYSVQLDSPDMLVFVAATPHCQAIRRTGSAALNLAYLAAGRVDAFWSFSTKIWDIAAGALLIQEAGGVLSGPRGEPFRLDTGHFLAAATPELHARFAELIRHAVP